MKKISFAVFTLFLFSSIVFAVEFVPSVMKVSAPENVQYSFNGNELTIPVTLTGTRGSITLLVFTKDQADNINMVRNGYLGWHRVNKIDTCIYAGSPIPMDIGSNNLYWSGKDNDGKQVPDGVYSYYLWGYDSFSERKLVTRFIDAAAWKNDRLVAKDYQGNMLAKPVIYGVDEWSSGGDEQGPISRTKWIIGSDPEDEANIETTTYMAYYDICKYTPSPYESDMFYIFTTDNNLFGHVRKYQYVPNGESILETSWGTDGEFTFSIQTGAGWWVRTQSFDYGGDDLLVATNTDHQGISTVADLVFVDAQDGTEAYRIDLSEWWISIESGEAGGQQSAGPNRLDYRNGLLYMGSHSCCWKEVIDTTADPTDEEEYMRWMNGNGDYTGDLNFLEDAEMPWVCNDYNSNPFMYQISADNNGFVCFPCFDMGAVSFGLMAPDGTGLGYHAFAGDSAGEREDKGEIMFLCDDTAYDGFYTDNNTGVSETINKSGYWFEACDSFKGVISSKPVAVDADAPAAFTVGQNSPNPFNPSTTINFTTEVDGNVSIEVFNMAGQKVATIMSGFITAGNHSTTWEASGLSGGVYFYTVKSGNASKTMKMTLLK
ncbi:MAG: T9SS type A sorting domain-containing protein [Candidatus Latescibacteria bacterium]|nr:T9SS type A sorting domain-containing protein [Candidatus Latescibacterota bacterium]